MQHSLRIAGLHKRISCPAGIVSRHISHYLHHLSIHRILFHNKLSPSSPLITHPVTTYSALGTKTLFYFSSSHQSESRKVSPSAVLSFPQIILPRMSHLDACSLRHNSSIVIAWKFVHLRGRVSSTVISRSVTGSYKISFLPNFSTQRCTPPRARATQYYQSVWQSVFQKR